MSIMRRLAWTQQPEAAGTRSIKHAQTLSHPASMKRFAYVGSTVLDEEEHEENGACLLFFPEARAAAACSPYLESL